MVRSDVLCRVGAERRAKRVDRFFLDGETGGRRMSAVGNQVPSARGKRSMQIEAGHGQRQPENYRVKKIAPRFHSSRQTIRRIVAGNR